MTKLMLGASITTLALTAAGLGSAHAYADDQSPGAEAPKRHAPHHFGKTGIDERVKTLARALDLDARQQAGVKRLLQGQRDEVRRIWNDESMPGSYRVIATQAVSDKTADEIRALLNDEQRKKYKPPRAPHDPLADRPSVETWMYPAKRNQLQVEPVNGGADAEIR